MIDEKKKIFSGSALKLIAVITMLIDHVAHFLFAQMPFMMETRFHALGYDISFYLICRLIGRIAFPIYCFLITEGFQHTHDRRKYALNLFIFALISEIPWNLAHGGTLFYKSQNVFFTLFLGLMCLIVYESYQDDRKKQLSYLLVLSLIALLLKADYGFKGMGLVFLLNLLRDKPIPRAIIGSSMLSNPAAAIVAFIPISYYNHERGFIQGKTAKYLFYAFYPVHMLILYLIKLSVWGYK